LKALLATAAGGADVLALVDREKPRPGPGEVLIGVRLAPVNWADVTGRRGTYAPVGGFDYPHPLGLEAMGTVVELGAGVRDLDVGDRVAAFTIGGGYAEFALASATATYRIPTEVSDEQAAAFPVVGPPAYNVVVAAGRARPGERILVTAAAGGVGSTIVQVCRKLGLGPVYAAAGSASRAEHARSLGAEAAIDYGSGSLSDAIATVTRGRGLDLVLDSVGGEIRAQAFSALVPLGRLVEFGNGSGMPEADYRGDALRGRVVAVAGFNLAVLRAHRPDLVRESAEQMLQWLAEGTVRIEVEDILPLEAGGEAHRRLETRQVNGKLLLRVS